ncbi:lipoprotein [Streptomyces sp. DG2A-72]|uniref:lipoprotein n=1 Tax=Streptomyces sp. DG2A-72 TaxID=3051386 RepID=UPI00265BC062|nr:lipoprotein [Streptomyces sp. DG2A-72]MDO0938862.1 lipoprotein [Streptomyces sp. DG2A-72]
MQVRAGIAGRGAVHVALLAGVLTGCSQAAPKEPEDKQASAPASADGAVAAKGGTIGAEGSSCELPVTFDIAEEWKAETVEGGPAADIADTLLHQGPVTLACEIDAKPAGNIGYLRVWTGDPAKDDARTALEAFVEAEAGASEETYRTFKTGGLDGAEVEYLYTSELLDETKKERALAVVTSDGPVVVHLGGLDSEEHEEMLPAYQLAKRTLRGN